MLLSLLNRAFLREEQKGAETAAPAAAPQEKETPKADNGKETEKKEAAKPEEAKKEESPKQEDSPKQEEEVLTLKSIQKGEDGKYFVKRGELIYKGDSPDEVVDNVLKGKEEADSYITKLKAVTEKVKVPDHLKRQEPKSEKVEAPSEEEIYQKHIAKEVRKERIDPKMLNWKRDDWNRHQEENNLKDWEITELRQSVKAVLDRAAKATDNDVAQLNTAFVNADELETATAEIRELALDSGLSPEDFDKIGYDDIIAEEYEYAEKNRGGMIKSARLVKAAQLKINKITRGKSPVKKDIEEVIKKGEAAKKDIKNPAGGGAVKDKVERPRTYEEARKQIREGKF